MAFQSSLLNRPLSAFSIPPELLEALSVRSIQSQGVASDETDNVTEQSEAQPAAVASSSGLGCQTCPGASFSTPEDQRAHFKTDWHRYNAKAKLNNSKTVTAEEFDDVVDGGCVLLGCADIRRVQHLRVGVGVVRLVTRSHHASAEEDQGRG